MSRGGASGNLDGNTDKGLGDIFITKYDTNGNRLWTVQPGTSWPDSGYGIDVDTSGNVYVTGSTSGNLDGNTKNNPYLGGKDIFITKYDTNGNRLWTVQPGTFSTNGGHGIAVDLSGNVYVTGSTSGGLDGNTSKGGDDIFITKYDTNGNRLWTVQPSTFVGDTGESIAVDTSGNVYVTGWTSGNLDGNTRKGGNDIFITMFDTNGSYLWTVQPGTSDYDYGYGIALDTSGNVYVTGSTDGNLDGNTNNGGYDIFISKYSH